MDDRTIVELRGELTRALDEIERLRADRDDAHAALRDIISWANQPEITAQAVLSQVHGVGYSAERAMELGAYWTRARQIVAAVDETTGREQPSSASALRAHE